MLDIIHNAIKHEVKNLKVNKWTILTCAIIIFLCVVVIIFIEKYIPKTIDTSLSQNIFLGLFTCAVISMVSAIIGYLHEREVLVEKASNNLQSLYINMSIDSLLIEETLDKLNTATSLEYLPFKNISNLSQLNVEIFNNMELGLFSPIRKNSNLSKVYTKLNQFHLVIYNIKNISMELETITLQYTYNFLQLQNIQILGTEIEQIDLENLEIKKKLINTRTENLHQLISDKRIQLENIAQDFFKYNGSKESWNDIKARLLLRVEDIIKR